jgi:hypothetical protein
MAFLTGLPGGLQSVSPNGKLVSVESGGEDVPHITSLTGDTRGEKPFTDMAVDAVDARMGRSQVAGEFRGHGVAGCAAEFRGIGIFPTVYRAGQDEQGQDAQNSIG